MDGLKRWLSTRLEQIRVLRRLLLAAIVFAVSNILFHIALVDAGVLSGGFLTGVQLDPAFSCGLPNNPPASALANDLFAGVHLRLIAFGLAFAGLSLFLYTIYRSCQGMLSGVPPRTALALLGLLGVLSLL